MVDISFSTSCYSIGKHQAQCGKSQLRHLGCHARWYAEHGYTYCWAPLISAGNVPSTRILTSHIQQVLWSPQAPVVPTLSIFIPDPLPMVVPIFHLEDWAWSVRLGKNFLTFFSFALYDTQYYLFFSLCLTSFMLCFQNVLSTYISY